LSAGIAAGPDGNLWFTEPDANKIGRITPAGKVTEFPTGISSNASLGAITAGPDGNVWFTENPESGTGAIGRITPAGQVTEFTSAGQVTAVSSPISGLAELSAIAAGPDGALWFPEYIPDTQLPSSESNYPQRLEIGRITTSGSCPKAKIESRHAIVSNKGATHVTLHCSTGPGPCSGTLTLTARVRISGHRRSQQKTIAHASYVIADDQTDKVTLQLTKTGRKLLRNARHHRLKVTAATAGASQTLTLTPKK
jgi:hypothetical protein